MLKIRLRRVGAKKSPRYRVVVADSRVSTVGKVVETIGTYNPLADPPAVVIDKERAEAWIKKGAQPSERVAKLLFGKTPEQPKTADVPTEALEVDSITENPSNT